MSAADADAAFSEFLAERRARGLFTFEVEDMLPVLERTGKSRPWLYYMLDKRIAAGQVRKDGKARWSVSRVA
jgi:hypothetical protein